MQVSNQLFNRRYSKSYYLFFSKKAQKIPLYKLFNFFLFKLQVLTLTQPLYKNFDKVQLYWLFSSKPVKIYFFSKKNKNIKLQFKFLSPKN